MPKRLTLYQFSLVASSIIGDNPQNFLTVSFNHFACYCKISRPYLIQYSPNKLLNLNPDHPSKNHFFWSNHPYNIRVMIISSLTEILELSTSGNIATSTT